MSQPLLSTNKKKMRVKVWSYLYVMTHLQGVIDKKHDFFRTKEACMLLYYFVELAPPKLATNSRVSFFPQHFCSTAIVP